MGFVDACVFSFYNCLFEDFQALLQKTLKFEGISRHNGFFGGWCWPFQFH